MNDPISTEFTLPNEATRAYIYKKGYFSKELLPYNENDNQHRYIIIKCLLIDKNNKNCTQSWKVDYNISSTGNIHNHLKNKHPNIPRNKEQEQVIESELFILSILSILSILLLLIY